ncbi:NADH:flavin oxidoreductase/NADH oxidase [Mesorhizobium sp. M7A.F.Ca.CA.001.09.2.1]|uniref:NADH:flavin oxidoreductase/NADH oxidase n=3 Tax=Mesorhizobium TaxID=68287 RepID=A0AB38T5H1_9HYPH|nr:MULTISPECIES: NADH:flavin oxidoreductase/NADH oxidase [Mesorhizobium]RUZ73055.1 NADH:flavin oxidoreductase/NADH oxidase [Mesorhizobium sp. M7A.F.Ca.US.003.02.2.1]AMX92661.1 oxidoreductase [Mesorhizobium ciceri]MBZ9717944.1 NADH:flavin oxidoreductase/NADH oxidase [Mesorhizobium sp. AD1-1]MDF3211341.1 NADH:flavin oxidoreductase/NADH oxidase [Mesorhizobium sp. LMG15046]MDF3217484.1 NADH:flavin oxidoreductase/NADH oxidase [Mesorhizobium ciceri]
MTASLFQSITLDGLTFPNRIAVAPMCQYSAEDGSASDWHLHHWMNLAMSGAGMVTVEMTDVERRGRITHGCLGLYSEDNEAAARRALDAARRVAAPGTKFGSQLAHAGRKASNRKPWEGGGPLKPNEDPWQTVSASAIPYDTGWNVPHALEDEEILQLIERFAEAARRAERAGFDFLELHAAHGYLIFQFLSPLSNQRTDRWGGALENRMRFAVEITKAVRKAVPKLMLGARLSVKDWVDGGFDVADAIEVAKALKDEGVAYLCCSSGGNSPLQKLPTGPGYQVHLAEAVRKGADIPTRAVGLIDDPKQAEAIVTEGRADMVALARAFLADPRWGWRAAATFSETIHPAPQLARSVTTMQHWMKAAG